MYSFHDILLSTSRVVHLESLHVSKTYADLLEGMPDAEYNEITIVRKRQAVRHMWGERATHIIPPTPETVVEAGREYPRLPELTYYALLTSERLHSGCASELVVIWFGPYDRDTGMPVLVERAVRDVPWDHLAEDFDY